MNILIIAVLILSLVTAFCAGAMFERSQDYIIDCWEEEDEDADYSEDED